MAVKYRLDFDTNPRVGDSSKIEWRLDIEQQSYVGVPLPLIGGSSPVMIEHQQDNDVYKPIIGSSATLSFIVTDDVTYDDFNTGGLREYRVKVYYKDAADVYRVYWDGFINPVDSAEIVNTTPYEVKFTATDHLGLLEQLSIDRTDVVADGGTLFGYVHRALFQTGLNLDILVDSKIEVAAGDALLNLTSSTSAFFDSEENVEGTMKDSVIGVLETLNLSVRQSFGRWVIFNCSTHGGSGTNEEITWNVFNAQGIAQTAITEDLRKIVSSDGPLRPANKDLIKTYRRPIGSVEARPDDLTQIEFVNNGDFNGNATGWDATGSLDTTLRFTNDVSLLPNVNDEDFITGGNAIYTNRNRHTINAADEIWFRNSVGFPIELTLPSVFEFEWKYKDGPSSWFLQGCENNVQVKTYITIRNRL